MGYNQIMDLTKQKCAPCEGGTLPITSKDREFAIYKSQVQKWMVSSDEKYIERDFTFKNFREALVFVNQVGEIAEEEGHHPDIFLHNWKKVRINLTTHAIHGLSVNDFIVAAKVDKIVD
jgi:4a-hydroxytetrahydrobiopterin dehydratase